MRNRVLVLCLIILGALILFRTGTRPEVVPEQKKGNITILLPTGGKIFVEIADTDEARELGLGNRDSIGDSEGMLFVFEAPDFHGIWMKGMRFPLDIVWLDEGLRVVAMKENVTVDTYPQSFFPKERASSVLELKAGTATKDEITVGSVLTLKR
ncbi:MAG: DUF192 domain-containing protein [bacterium]|nr:DUF192 domain-containing protein [bacterium]